MHNFKNDIIEATDGEPIEAIVIEAMAWAYNSKERFAAGDARKGEVLAWDEAAPLLDYNYTTGFGTQDCHSVIVWTASRVIYVHEYDGATSLEWVPRNPVGDAQVIEVFETNTALIEERRI